MNTKIHEWKDNKFNHRGHPLLTACRGRRERIPAYSLQGQEEFLIHCNHGLTRINPDEVAHNAPHGASTVFLDGITPDNDPPHEWQVNFLPWLRHSRTRGQAGFFRPVGVFVRSFFYKRAYTKLRPQPPAITTQGSRNCRQTSLLPAEKANN